MRRPIAVALFATVGGCGETTSTPYRFDATIDPGAATVVVDNMDNNFALTYEFPSYEDAVADMHVPVVVTYQGTTMSSEITPGWCVQRASELNLHVGQLRHEALAYSIVNYVPTVYSARCVGTDQSFDVTP